MRHSMENKDCKQWSTVKEELEAQDNYNEEDCIILIPKLQMLVVIL